ncbi:HugZ family protein [Mesobacterium pallidum]|uniref:HugZ family pyridoxamine 5'-phosphate oxidase n=1 Tax=Mesobacterium pallidum TaxID=2872037 RepID=UPI001EE20503|nr:pyridoxamine 5'-phosphate oxidase family protein [Mesobacterium pallidum]
MCADKINPIRPTDDEARALARSLLEGARFAALAVTDATTGTPMVTRIALGTDARGTPLSLVSTLSQHTTALAKDPNCALLVGEPGDKGDPLTHPRLSIQARAEIVARDDPRHAPLADRYLADHPKARLYADFGDFRYVLFTPTRALLNGGFGKAFELTPDDLAK